MVQPWCVRFLTHNCSADQGLPGSNLLLTGVLATLRFLFAKIAVDECYGDFSPTITCPLSMNRPFYSETVTARAASVTSSRRLQKYIAIRTETTSSAAPNSPATYLVLLLSTVSGSKNSCMNVLCAACNMTPGHKLPDFSLIHVHTKLMTGSNTVNSGR